MRWTIKTRITEGNESWFETLCIVFSTEKLGMMERLLEASNITFKIEKEHEFPLPSP